MATQSRVKSAERTMDVLNLLARMSTPLTTGEISEGVGMPKSTTYHLLNVMQERRFVSYWDDHRVWTLGIAAFEVGSSYMRNDPLVREGHRFLQALTTKTGATSHIAILQGSDVVYVDKWEPSTHGVRLVTDMGTRLPAHLTAVGRAILSRLSPEEVARIYDNYSWPTRTGEGPSSLAELQSVLEQVREQGFAEEVGNTTDGIACVASPLRTSHGRIAASMGVAFLSSLATPQALPEFRRAVLDTTDAFSAALGAL